MGYASFQKRPCGLINTVNTIHRERDWYYTAPTTKQQIHVATFSQDNNTLTLHNHPYTGTMTTTRCVRAIFEDLLGKSVMCYRDKGYIHCNGVKVKFGEPITMFNYEEQNK